MIYLDRGLATMGNGRVGVGWCDRLIRSPSALIFSPVEWVLQGSSGRRRRSHPLEAEGGRCGGGVVGRLRRVVRRPGGAIRSQFKQDAPLAALNQGHVTRDVILVAIFIFIFITGSWDLYFSHLPLGFSPSATI